MKMSEQLSFEEAKRLSIKKWEMHVEDGGFSERVAKDKELKKLIGYCGFCERNNSNCHRCEFRKVAGVCYHKQSFFYKWNYNYSQENAQKILDVIKNLESKK